MQYDIRPWTDMRTLLLRLDWMAEQSPDSGPGGTLPKPLGRMQQQISVTPPKGNGDGRSQFLR